MKINRQKSDQLKEHLQALPEEEAANPTFVSASIHRIMDAEDAVAKAQDDLAIAEGEERRYWKLKLL